MIERERFLKLADRRLFGGRMTESQRAGISAVLDEWVLRKLTNEDMLAYILATAKWETAHTMQPVRETLAVTDAQARSRLAGVWYAAPDPVTGQSYYGRGLVQLTHKRNYAEMDRILHSRFVKTHSDFDLVNHPDMALVPEIAIAITFEGMLRGDSGVGDFTGKCLEDYFGNGRRNFVGARKIINGTDHDQDIAEIARLFLDCLVGQEPAPAMLRYGANGPEVEALQRRLVSLGYSTGGVDGDFGPATQKAVMEFQRAAGLTVDGVVGPATHSKLAQS